MQQFKVEPLEVTLAAPSQKVCDAIDLIFGEKVSWFPLGGTKWANIEDCPLEFHLMIAQTGQVVIVPGTGEFSIEVNDKGDSTNMIVRLTADCEKPDWLEDEDLLGLLGQINDLVVESVEDLAIDLNGPESVDGPEAA